MYRSIKYFCSVVVLSLYFMASSFAQDAMMLVRVEGKKVFTIVTFTGVPPESKAFWKQDISGAKFIKIEQPYHYPYWDTAHNVLTVNIDKYPEEYNCNFILVCELPKNVTEYLTWGKSVFYYEPIGEEGKFIYLPPKEFTIADLKKQNNYLLVEADKDANPNDFFPDELPQRQIVLPVQQQPKQTEVAVAKEEKPLNSETIKQSLETEQVKKIEPSKVIKEEPQPIKVETKPIEVPKPVKIEPVKTETVKVEPVKVEPVKTEPIKTEPIKTETVKIEPIKAEPVKVEPVKVEPTKVEPAKVTKAEPLTAQPLKVAQKESIVKTIAGFEVTEEDYQPDPDGYKYYVQFSAQAKPRDISKWRNVPLKSGDKMQQLPIDGWYKCIIGPFKTKAEGLERLQYYRPYFNHLFLAKYKL
ncbi:MAG: hypothetical protein LBR36_05395 [Bacteroidales bacterium]|jgi:hypothetical protein|nr:hypothetical protein [Bacteroidales bacterium]